MAKLFRLDDTVTQMQTDIACMLRLVGMIEPEGVQAVFRELVENLDGLGIQAHKLIDDAEKDAETADAG